MRRTRVYAQHNDLTSIGVVFLCVVAYFMHRSILDQLYPGEILTTLENIEGNRTDYKNGRESVRFLNYCSMFAYCNIE